MAKKLAGPDFLLPEAVRLCDAAEPGPKRSDRPDLYLPQAEEPYEARVLQQRAEELCDLAEAGLYETARLRVDSYRPKAKLQEAASIQSAEIAGPDLPEVGLYSDVCIGQPI